MPAPMDWPFEGARAGEAPMPDPHGCDLQFAALFHRAQGRNLDVERRLLPRRH